MPQPDPAMLEQMQKGGLGGLPGGLPGGMGGGIGGSAALPRRHAEASGHGRRLFRVAGPGEEEMTVELETERLRLRQLRESDHETLAQYHADPELTRFLGGPATPVDSWRWLLSMLGHWTLRGFGYLGIEEKASGGALRRRRPHPAFRLAGA